MIDQTVLDIAKLLKDNNIEFSSQVLSVNNKTNDEWKHVLFNVNLNSENFQFKKGLACLEENVSYQFNYHNFVLKRVDKTLKAGRSRSENFKKYSSYFIRYDNYSYIEKVNEAEFLYCLCSDVDLSDDSFEDFCANLGLDTDSRKALETYLECQKTGNKLIKVLGYPLFNKIREILEDY